MNSQISKAALAAAFILCTGAIGAQAQSGKAGAGSVAGAANPAMNSGSNGSASIDHRS